MSIVSGSNTGLTTAANPLATTPSIANLPVPLANTEVFYVFPAGTKRFALQNRSDGIIKLAYIIGDSGSVYYTVWPGDEFIENDIHYAASVTIYLQSPKASQIVEIRSWV